MMDGRRILTIWLCAAALGFSVTLARAAEAAPDPASGQSPGQAMAAPQAPTFAPAVMDGIQHLYAHDYRGAVERLSAAAQADPKDAAAHYYLGYAYYRLGRFEQARTSFAAAYEADPHFSPEPAQP